MNRLGLSKLRCPRCAAELELQVVQARSVTLDDRALHALDDLGPDAVQMARDNVQTGVLRCGACDVWFPIVNGIPVLLVFRTGLHDDFVLRFGPQCHGVTLASAPRWEAESGERSTQTTFTEEWLTTPTDELTFLFTEEDLTQLHRDVWLKWKNGAPTSVKTVLDVGCGRGVEARILRRIVPGAQAFGIDLNLSMIQRGYAYQDDPLLHLLVCSLFHPPFEHHSFDLVYTQGVIHHTYSTKDAFHSIARFVTDAGYLFVWVYGLDDDLVPRGAIGVIARAALAFEHAVRPVLARAPTAVRSAVINVGSYVAHPLLKTRVKNKDQYTLSNSRHNLRDRLTPRFAHRHGFNEVVEWFEDLGFTCSVQSPSAYRKIFGKRAFGVGVIGHREESASASPAARVVAGRAMAS